MSAHPPLFLESSVVCGILHQVFFREPDEAYLEQLFGQGTLQYWPEEFIPEVVRKSHQTFAFSSFNIEFLRSDYTRLFVGPVQKQAYPWGSYYTDKYQSLNGETTQQLRYFMKRYAIELQFEGNEMPDHVGIIFAILSELFKNNEEEAIKELIEDNLQSWFSQFTDRVSECAETIYFGHFAVLAEAFMSYWFQAMSEVSEVSEM